ncbi:TPA: beta strand repeat-containing protein, partial [Haemophilus influenzae]
NVSGKEKGGRAIVWGDIALIDGNINAQGSDIAKTGGFVETSGHDLFIKDNAIVDAKEWLLDPNDVSINAEEVGRSDANLENTEYTGTGESANDPKRNNNTKTTLTNSTLERILARGSFVNITATKHIYVNSSINLSNGSLTLYAEKNGIQINKDITTGDDNRGANLTIKSGDWVDIHSNISLGTQGNLNITAKSVAFEGQNGGKARRAAEAQVVAQGTITITGDRRDFRANNVSFNGTGHGLEIISTVGNLSHKLDGEINISGKVAIKQLPPKTLKHWQISSKSYWNVSALNLERGANFTFVKYAEGNHAGPTTPGRDFAGVDFNGLNSKMSFNIPSDASVTFKLKPSEAIRNTKPSPYLFKSNITATGGGSILFDMYANHSGRGAELSMGEINISGNTKFTLQSHVRNNDAFKINKDLTINATNSNFTLKQTADTFADGYGNNAINTTHNIRILGGNVTLGGQNSSSRITGNITIEQTANVILEADNSYNANNQGSRTINLGNLTVKGNLSLTGENANINGNLSVSSGAIFKGKTRSSLNITNTFTNDGDAEINITQGVVKLGNITNGGNLNITTNAKSNQKSVINGNITNNKGDLNIIDRKSDAEIQIGGNISQKEGNLTISSDKINITKQTTIKKGVNGENSNSLAKSQANLTIKTKELKLTGDLNISGFDKAEIVAKNGSNLTIGNGNDSGSANAKKVTFNNVKDSNISAGDHNVTLNSKVETFGDSSAESSDGSNAGLTINAKNVTVNKDITSNKTVNITASEKLTTKADATINATNGNVKVTTQTGDIKGQVKSTSGDVEITASGDTLKVSNITGQNVTVTANSGAITTTKGSTINATTGDANITTSTGVINGEVKSASGNVNITASGDTLNVSNVSGNAVTITADEGKLTTQAGSTVSATNGVTASSQSGDIGGTISGKTVSVTATTDSLTVKGSAKINATEGAATLTATKGTLTTAADSSISAASGILTINAKDAKLDGAASGN